jgi:molybdate/tungstate transport system substrate-binding protein
VSRSAGLALLGLGLITALAVLAVVADRPAARGLEELRVLHASGLTPFLDAIREDCEADIGVRILNEPSGSQVACRKLVELGKPCDLLMLADAALVGTLLGGTASWRIDFATDEVVLAVGSRARHVDDAERGWPAVLRRDEVTLARVDEGQGPIGYRTLLVWRLQDDLGEAGLFDALTARTARVVDHATLLMPLLAHGEVDYAFTYRSLCIATSQRFIPLDRRVNLGDPDLDYSGARVSYRKPGAGPERRIEVAGAPIFWTLTAPDAGGLPARARRFVAYVLGRKAALLEAVGLRALGPARFHGGETSAAAEARRAFAAITVEAGGLEAR